MKKMMTLMAMLTIALTMFAKDIKTVVFTTTPQMHCENCENKIKGNLKFEKGIKDIQTSVSEQKVTITYDADKTETGKLIKAFSKIGYTATVVNGEKACEEQKGCACCAQKPEASKSEGSCCAKKQETSKSEGSCCAKKQETSKSEGSCCKKSEGGCCKNKAEVKK